MNHHCKSSKISAYNFTANETSTWSVLGNDRMNTLILQTLLCRFRLDTQRHLLPQCLQKQKHPQPASADSRIYAHCIPVLSSENTHYPSSSSQNPLRLVTISKKFLVQNKSTLSLLSLQWDLMSSPHSLSYELQEQPLRNLSSPILSLNTATGSIFLKRESGCAIPLPAKEELTSLDLKIPYHQVPVCICSHISCHFQTAIFAADTQHCLLFSKHLKLLHTSMPLHVTSAGIFFHLV